MMKTKINILSKLMLVIGIAAMLPLSCGKKNAGAGSTSGDTGKVYHWKMVTSWPPDFPILGEGAKQIAQMIDEMSNGQLKIRVYGAGELVPGLGVFDAVSEGTAEMGHSCAYYWTGKVPEAVFFTTVPFGLMSTQMNAWMLAGNGMKLWKGVYAKYNVVPFIAGNSGFQMGGWFRKPINSVKDVKGLKMRIPGVGGKVLTKLGGSAMTVAAGEIYTNLERGVIDATEWIGPFHDDIMGFSKVAKYYYYPGWHEPGTQFELIVNKEKYDSLPPHLQKIIEAASLASSVWVRAQFEAKNAEYLAKLRKNKDVTIKKFPEDFLKAAKKATDEVMAEQIKEHPDMKPIYDDFVKFRKQMIDWYKISEGNFLDIQK